jgi:hypothetical protein
MVDRFIVGPIVDDLLGIGLSGRSVILATAFYSRGLLERIVGKPRQVEFVCRLDTRNAEDWQNGLVAPDALLTMLRRFDAEDIPTRLYVRPDAHAKAYVGSAAALIGSANLTMRGFGGGSEILERLTSRKHLADLRTSLREYRDTFQLMTLDALEEYVDRHRAAVTRARRRRPSIEDKLPRVRRDSIPRLGSYSEFLGWLAVQPEEAARETLARARGKGQLSGHIFSNFYGLRQYLIANPAELNRFAVESPGSYRLSRDAATEARIADFVRRHAADEVDFSLDTWRTYLPVECGGRAGRHGGTIGNLNRMLPLVARYLREGLT